MSTRDKILNLEQIYEAWRSEMRKLSMSITPSIEENTKMYNQIRGQLESSTAGDMTALFAYDDFSMKLSNLTDMTSQLNFHLNVQELEEPAMQQPLFLYRKPYTDHFIVNASVEARVTFIDSISLKFSINFQNQLTSLLMNIYHTSNGSRRRLEGMPDAKEVFGLAVHGNILRAVRENTSEPWQTYLAYILELGEVTEMNSLSEMYHLPPEYKEIPGQAVNCELVSVNGDTDCDLRGALLKYAFTFAKFTVLWKNDSVLYMNLEDDQANIASSSTAKPETKPFKRTHRGEEAAYDSNGVTADKKPERFKRPMQPTKVTRGTQANTLTLKESCSIGVMRTRTMSESLAPKVV